MTTPQWSRSLFDDFFVKPPQAVNSYLSEPNFLENNLKYSGQQKEQVEQIVQEEREAKNKMPTYKGLENYKLLEKMGE